MKNLIFYLFFVALIFTSCKEGHNGAEKEEQPVKHKVKKVVQEKELDSSCFTSNNIYPSTAWLWTQSWTTYSNNVKNKSDSLYSITSPELFFTKESLIKLKSITKDANGVLLYYILKDGDTDPSLAMANLVGCKRLKKDSIVLVNWRHGDEEFLPIASIQKFITNWENANKEREEDIKGYVPVKAYNYSWETLESLYNSKDHISGIRVKYGVRTLGPGEIVNFTPKNKPIEMVTGNIVVCNILTSWEEDSDITFSEVIKNLTDSNQELDFALPCPEFCGKE